jgi:hypothetical protein
MAEPAPDSVVVKTIGPLPENITNRQLIETVARYIETRPQRGVSSSEYWPFKRCLMGGRARNESVTGDQVLSGASRRGIAPALNERGIPPQAGRERGRLCRLVGG